MGKVLVFQDVTSFPFVTMTILHLLWERIIVLPCLYSANIFVSQVCEIS